MPLTPPPPAAVPLPKQAWGGALLFILSACVAVPPANTPRPAAVAVAFDFRAEKGSWTEGLADPATGRAVTPDDPVRVASVSKLVVAIGVMRLVEQGALRLDEDVSRFLDWPVRNSNFPDRPITLRMLLSHTSSLRDGDDAYVVPLGQTVKGALADPAVWDALHPPGEGYFAYSNFNFPLIASVMEMATGERFDLLMKRLVIGPMNLDACFNWPTCSDDAIARAVVLTQDGKPVRDDLGGKRPDCPVYVPEGGACDLNRWRLGENGALFSPQGGLRISARDLARIGRMLMNQGTIDGVKILSASSVDLLLAPAWQFSGANGSRVGESRTMCSYGLAVQQLANRGPGCALDPASTGFDWAGHSGDAYGLRSGLWFDREKGVGIAYFVTGLSDEPKVGRSGFTVAEEDVFRRAVALIR
jgi:CubicO group peptidase (beta-lactamase class C family)